MSDLEPKEYLVKSFDAVASEMKDKIHKMTSFLNVFQVKDITGTEMPDYKMASIYETMIMHLYIKKLRGEEDWDNSQFPQTVYTNMYEHIVQCFEALNIKILIFFTSLNVLRI